MSIARKATLLVGALGTATVMASTAEGGEGGRGKKHWRAPAYVVVPAQPVIVVPKHHKHRGKPHHHHHHHYHQAPPPVYYAPPPPVYPHPGPGSVHFGVTLPIR